MRASWIAWLVLLTFVWVPAASSAQSLRPRIGFGLTTTVTTDSENPVGLGVHVRGSLPVNPDLSFGVDAGIAGFVFGGREEASYYATPQVLAIVTLNSAQFRSPYVLFGLGGYLPLGGKTEQSASGPSITLGIGWAVSLQQTSVYFELKPSLVIAKDSAKLNLPLNIGVVL